MQTLGKSLVDTIKNRGVVVRVKAVSVEFGDVLGKIKALFRNPLRSPNAGNLLAIEEGSLPLARPVAS